MNYQTDHSLLYSILAARSSKLNFDTIQEITNFKRDNLGIYKEYLKKEPVSRMCCDIKALLCAQRLKHYIHDNKEIETFVRNMIDDMDVSFDRVVGQLASAMPLGFSTAEIIFSQNKNKKAIVKSIDVLDHEKISFKGKKGIITHVVYNDDRSISIPYWKTIHITRGYSTDFDDPFGVPEMKAALPYIKAKMTFYSNMMVASHKLATGLLIFSLDNSKEVKIIDSKGRARKVDKSTAVQEQVKNIDNMPVVLLGKDDTVQNIPLNSGMDLWLPGIDKFNSDIKKAFSVADHIVDGIQNLPQTATAINSMFSVTDSTIYAFIQSVNRELINKIVKPVVQWNFGEQSNYGKFDIEPVNPDKDTVQFNNLLQAIGYGAVDVNSYEVKNKINEFLGLSDTNKEKEIQALYQQAMMQQIQSQVMPQEAPEQPVPKE